MSKSSWIRQSDVPSATPRTLPRTRWLRGHPAVEAAFEGALQWLAGEPEGIAFTAAFLQRIPMQSLNDLLELREPGCTQDPQRRAAVLRRVKQDLGLHAIIRLADEAGQEHVQTLRHPDTRAASPRKLPPAFHTVTWVSNYTPHRVLPAGLARLAGRTAELPAAGRGLRARLGFTDRYEVINREERNLAAILFALLQDTANLDRFLEVCGTTATPAERADHALFFEFAMVRDLWHSRVSGDNDLARTLILEHLGATPADLATCSIEDFNRRCGAPRPSRDTIQMPANWSIPCMAEHMDNDLLRRACIFKWSFNAKPDLVLRLGRDRALCVEMKLESDEGKYPSTKKDRAVFAERGLDLVGQTDVQRSLMDDLLGFDTEFALLVAKPGAAAGGYRTVTWADVFGALDLQRSPAFVRRTVSAVLARSA